MSTVCRSTCISSEGYIYSGRKSWTSPVRHTHAESNFSLFILSLYALACLELINPQTISWFIIVNAPKCNLSVFIYLFIYQICVCVHTHFKIPWTIVSRLFCGWGVTLMKVMQASVKHHGLHNPLICHQSNVFYEMKRHLQHHLNPLQQCSSSGFSFLIYVAIPLAFRPTSMDKMDTFNADCELASKPSPFACQEHSPYGLSVTVHSGIILSKWHNSLHRSNMWWQICVVLCMSQ